MKKNWIFSLVPITALLIAFEGLCFATNLVIRQKYFDVTPSRETFLSNLREQYEAPHFDETTGWVNPTHATEPDGSRISPDNPASVAPCLSMYGGSFVFGSEVSDKQSWGNQIAQRLRCRVLNYGVPGYGTDQAYLRFLHNVLDQSPQVILGILSENIMSNVNQNRSYLLTVARVGPLKPIFYLDDQNELRLEPVPRLSSGSYEEFVRNPRLILKHDYFVPGLNPHAKPRVGFPYSVNLLGALANKRLQDSLISTFLGRPPWWEDFADPSHPSRAFAVTQAIVDRFVETARKRGTRPIVAFLPQARDFPRRFQTGKWIYSELYSGCQSRGYECFDAGTALVAKLGASELQSVQAVCRYFCPAAYLGGHYNGRGNALLAEVTIDHLANPTTYSASAERAPRR
jgi:hypothetical protein